MNIKTTLGLLSAATAATVVLTGCASGLDSSESTDTTTAASTSPSSEAPASSSSAAPSSDPSTGAAPSASTDPSAGEKPSAGDLDAAQIVIQSSSEVSPGTLQYGSSNRASGSIEWMALTGRASYDGEKCATVVTLTGPGGDVLFTDRQASCSGSTSFTLQDSRNGTGEFTVDVSMAPWDDADSPVEESTTFTVIARGA